VVDLADCDRPEEYLPHLARLPKLRTLVVGGHSVGDDEVRAIKSFPSLKGLVLDSTFVSDNEVAAPNKHTARPCGLQDRASCGCVVG